MSRAKRLVEALKELDFIHDPDKMPSAMKYRSWLDHIVSNFGVSVDQARKLIGGKTNKEIGEIVGNLEKQR